MYWRLVRSLGNALLGIRCPAVTDLVIAVHVRHKYTQKKREIKMVGLPKSQMEVPPLTRTRQSYKRTGVPVLGGGVKEGPAWGLTPLPAAPH